MRKVIMKYLGKDDFGRHTYQADNGSESVYKKFVTEYGEQLKPSIANQINFWCTYCTWRHNPITYSIAHERVNVELSEYAACNPYC